MYTAKYVINTDIWLSDWWEITCSILKTPGNLHKPARSQNTIHNTIAALNHITGSYAKHSASTVLSSENKLFYSVSARFT